MLMAVSWLTLASSHNPFKWIRIIAIRSDYINYKGNHIPWLPFCIEYAYVFNIYKAIYLITNFFLPFIYMPDGRRDTSVPAYLPSIEKMRLSAFLFSSLMVIFLMPVAI